MLKPTTLAMILAGGRVNELGVLTHYRPKSSVPFGGFARVIDFPLTNLMRSNIEQIAILSQYRSYSLINHIGTGAAWDMIGRYRGISILPPFKDYDNAHWYRGSADAVYQNLDYIQHHAPSEILILSGDHIYEMDYQKMIDYHHQTGADMTAAFIEVDPAKAHRFGVAEIEGDEAIGGRLRSYEEKPAQPRSNYASLTVFCFKPEVLYKVLKDNQADDSYEFGSDIIPRMMAEGYHLQGYKFNGYWGYTRTIEEYWQTAMDLLGPNPKIDMEAWGIRTNLEHRDLRDCQPLQVGANAQIENAMVYNGGKIDGIVRNSIIFPGVEVEKGAEVHDSVLFFDNKVKAGAILNKVVSDVDTTFGANAQVGIASETKPGESNGITVIGWNNHVPDGMKIGKQCTVSPGIAAEKWSSPLKDGEELT